MRRTLCSLAVVAAVLLAASSLALGATWKTNVNYGATTPMDLYVPDGVGASPAVVVSLHYCGGTAANAHGWFQSYADTNKFLIIAPKSAGSCFDAGLGRTGERANIVKMVQYVVTNNSADPRKVYAAGPSSGACMTHALLASYPDVFAGGSSLAGVPAGAWTGGGAYGWSAPASTTAVQWGDKVRNADPGFTGSRPRIQFWQGMGDTNLTYSQTYPAEVAQWTNVFGVTDANATKENIKPAGASNTWARTSYKDCTGLVVVEANSGPSNVVHDLTPEGLWGDVVRFFGLTSGGTPVGSCGGTGGSGGGAGGATGTGGAIGTGGAGGRGGAGGATGTGGSAGGRGGSGGSTGSAGATGSAGNGGPGAGGRGGSSGSTGSGGNTSSTGAGGSASGAAGTTGAGGSASGAAGTTGSPGAGGNASGAAGTTGAGGNATGAAGNTGMTGTGGSASGVAGTTGTGNASGAAGTTGAGGSTGTGAAGNSGTGNTGGGDDAGGWSCIVAGRTDGGGIALLLIGMTALVLRRRARR